MIREECELADQETGHAQHPGRAAVQVESPAHI